MFSTIIGVTTPVIETRYDKVKFIKAMVVSVVIDFSIFLLIVKQFI